MFGGNAQSNQYNPAYLASSKNSAGGSGRQPASDDGFHTQPVRITPNWRRKVVFAVAALMCIVVAIFVLRATGDRDEQIHHDAPCGGLYSEDVCDVLESSA